MDCARNGRCVHEKRPSANRGSYKIKYSISAASTKKPLKAIATMPSTSRFVFAILIASSLGFAATAGQVAAEEANGSGQKKPLRKYW